MHKSGFVNIIGRPNVGKSTLMNALVGERMSIITNKPQTTRHRILGIVSDENYQVVFSDTPGFIDDPAYKMQEHMNAFVKSTFQDGDLMLFMTEVGETYEDDHPLFAKLQKIKAPIFLIINKIDTISKEEVLLEIQKWKDKMEFKEIIPISALQQGNTQKLFDLVLENMPEGPVYYPKDQFTDKPERFFVSEIIREKILEQYHQEIPYSCEVAVESFKETKTNKGEPLVRISTIIYVNRKTQKSIIIGKHGAAIKALGTKARMSIEKFLDSKVFLEMHVKVKEGWRDSDNILRGLGYRD